MKNRSNNCYLFASIRTETARLLEERGIRYKVSFQDLVSFVAVLR